MRVAVEPPEPGQADRPGESPHEKRRVGRPGDRREARRDRVEAAFVAQTRERRQRARVERGGERIRTRAVGEEDDD